MSKAIAAIVLALLLCSCADELESLKAELAARTEEMRGQPPPPLPALGPPPPAFRYEGNKLPDPFFPNGR